jgi:hypothetical protein
MSRPQADHRTRKEVARESDEATDRLLTRLPVSKDRLVILDSRIASPDKSPEDASIEWLRFLVSLRVPCDSNLPSEVTNIFVNRIGCSAPSRAGKPN